MVRKYRKISEEVDSKAFKFYRYLEDALEGEAFDFIKSLTLETNVYLFSGIIRNYFLHNYLIRDVDLVVGNSVDLSKILKENTYSVNSFGGYKFNLGAKKFDLWLVENTWALNIEKRIEWKLFSYLPKSVFFNFSSIIYSINDKKFYYTEDFLKFLKTREIDYVFRENLKKDLCIVNSIYYSEKYNLKISPRLYRLINTWQKKYKFDLEETQIKHFEKVLYSKKYIETKLEMGNN
ncbi:hypothetical protein DFQ04_0046 [Algoriphagus boseongensis]|uniref:Poly A polymerase head domain-containing protein n=1 Tax=Algoriphagus boseongensis TaxID=1442587 RepID=A0A4R6T5A4_9BACT|nr:hypothetical protein [Algoriphagus boseongensis]TDQ18248.1 hypothetical protein DFQ04_0046 [Algoriphagus boseongensis]